MQMIASFEAGEREVHCVLKKVSLPGEWWKPGSSKDNGYLVEGMRLSRAYFMMDDFCMLAHQKNVTIHREFLYRKFQ